MRRRAATAAVGMMVGAAILVSSPAGAASTTQVIQGEVLRLVSVADWEAAASLRLGESVQWDVSVSADAPDPGTVAIGVSASGEAPLGIDAVLCTSEWRSTGCPGSATVLRTAWDIPRDGVEVPLVASKDGDVMHLRLTVALRSADAAGSTEVRVHAHGSGESVVASSTGELATTGMSSVVPWISGGGLALVVLGLLLGAVRRRRVLLAGENGS